MMHQNTVTVEDKIDEKPVATIEELDAVQLELDNPDTVVRNLRKSLLIESDWTQNRDVIDANNTNIKHIVRH